MTRRAPSNPPPSSRSPGTVSIRSFWPFARVLGDYEQELGILREAGIDVASFADSLTRIPMPVAKLLIATSLQKSRDPALGLHAGECVEIGDFAPIDQMTRNCSTLREAILLGQRYAKLQDEGVETELTELASEATLRIRNLDPSRHAVVNEFQVTSTIKRLGFFLHRELPVTEVHLRNEVATDPAEYERALGGRIRLGAQHNAVVFPRALLDVPALHPNSNLLPLFDEQAGRLLGQISRGESFSQKVRQLVERGLEDGHVGMADIARKLSMSEATLRRRLLEEQTTHKELLNQVRRERALSHVEERHASLGEIGFRLGFSSPSAFGRAFRRWIGVSPVEYRQRLKVP